MDKLTTEFGSQRVRSTKAILAFQAFKKVDWLDPAVTCCLQRSRSVGKGPAAMGGCRRVAAVAAKREVHTQSNAWR